MTPHRKQKLYRKRTPWARHRFSRNARWAQRAMRAGVLAQGMAQVQAIRQSVAPKAEKVAAIAEAVLATQKAAAKIPLPGAKIP